MEKKRRRTQTLNDGRLHDYNVYRLLAGRLLHEGGQKELYRKR